MTGANMIRQYPPADRQTFFVGTNKPKTNGEI